MPSGPRLAHREADQGVQVFSGFRVERKLRSEQKQRHQSPIPSPPAPFGANLGDKAAAPVEGRFRGGGVAIGHHEMPGRALDPSGSPPFPSWLCHGIQGATRAGSRPHTVEEAQAPFSDPAGGGLPRPPCHLPAEGSDNSRNNSWSRGRAGPVLPVTRWGLTGSSFSLPDSRGSASREPSLKTSSCCSRSRFRRVVQTTPGSLPGLPRRGLCAGDTQSRQTRASTPPPLSCGRCGMNSKCRHGRKKKMCQQQHVSSRETLSSCLSQEKRTPYSVSGMRERSERETWSWTSEELRAQKSAVSGSGDGGPWPPLNYDMEMVGLASSVAALHATTCTALLST